MREGLVVLLVLTGCGVAQQNPTGGVTTARTRAPVLSCPASPAKQVFTSAMCLCGDYRAVGQGAWVEGGAAAMNGSLDVVGTHHFSGDVISAGGVSGVGALEVGGSLSTNGRVEGVGSVKVTRDVSAVRGVEGVGQLEVGGTLFTPQGEAWTGRATVANKAAVGAPFDAPCGCDERTLLDVKAKVAQALEHNDNAAAGIPLHESVGTHALTLGSGSYAFEGVTAVGAHTVTIDGAVALYVKGDFTAVGRTTFAVTKGSTLDLYVDGALEVVGDSSFGEGASPGSVRLYVASGEPISFVGQQRVIGSLYAPTADLELVGDTTFEGSLFVRNVEGVGQLEVRAAGQVVATPADDVCRPQPVVQGIE